MLGGLPRHTRLASRVPRLANAVIRQPAIARAARYLAGIDQRRDLPRFARQTFRRWFRDRGTISGGRPVTLWVDTFTDHFSPEVGQAAVRVLEDAGYRVAIVDGAVCCGLTWISSGQFSAARRQLRRSLDALGPALAAGTPVVGLEPSCTAVLRHDVTELLPDDPRASQVAAATRTLAELLTGTPSWTPRHSTECERWRSPTATSMPSWAGGSTKRC